MSQAPTRITTGEALDSALESSLVARLRALAAYSVAAAAGWYVGYSAVRPAEPLGPVTLMLTAYRFAALVEMAGLALVVSGLAVVIHGRSAAFVGPVSVAVALAAAASRGNTAEILPLTLPGTMGGWPVRSLIFEHWLWLGVLAIGGIVARWVDSWARSGGGSGEIDSGMEGAAVDSATEMRRAVGAVSATALVAYILLNLLGGRLQAPVLRGQVFFAVGVAFYVGAVAGAGVFRIRSALWLLGAVAIVATFAYGWTQPLPAVARASASGRLLLPTVLRPLPIEYAALGTIGTFFGFRTAQRMFGDGRAS